MDPEIVENIAQSDLSPHVRSIAIKKVNNPELLKKPMFQEKSRPLKREILFLLEDDDVFNEVALYDFDPIIRKIALELISDPLILSEFILICDEFELQKMAIENIYSFEIPESLLEKIDDPDLVEKMERKLNRLIDS